VSIPFLGSVNFIGESSPDEIISFFSGEDCFSGELPTNESKSSSEVAAELKISVICINV